MNVLNLLRNNAPSILTGMAIFGVALTAVKTAEATSKAMHILDEEAINPRNTPGDAIKACWKCYIFPASILAGTILCELGVVYVQTNDYKKAIAALAWSEAKRIEYQEMEKSLFGPDYPGAMQDHILETHRKEASIPDEPLREGMIWCWEPESEQFIQTNTEQIIWAELTTNKIFQNNGSITFNQFLDLFPGAKKMEWGNHFGWYMYDEDGVWDYNWSFYQGGSPWIDIKPVYDKEKNIFVIRYGMRPGDDPDCVDLEGDYIEDPEQFVVQNAIDWKDNKKAKKTKKS